MATVKIDGYVQAYHFDHMKEGQVCWGFNESAMKPHSDKVVHEFKHSFEVEVPDQVNVVAGMVANLEAAKKKALDDYNATVKQINDRLQKLLAITNEVSA